MIGIVLRLARMLRWPYSGPARFRVGSAQVYVEAAVDNVMLPRLELGRDGDRAWLAVSLGDGSSDDVLSATLAFAWRRPRPGAGSVALPPRGVGWPYRLLGLETVR